jgi:hypothetical protein
LRSTTRTARAASDGVTATSITSGVTGAASGVVEFGFTVMIGNPWVTVAVTANPPAKADWVHTGPPSPAWTSIASVISPDFSRIASRPAISLVSGLDGSSSAATAPPPTPPAWSITAASASTLGRVR